MDIRCYKCYHLYPFNMKEGTKLRSFTKVPIGQCVEALTTSKLVNKKLMEGQSTGRDDEVGSIDRFVDVEACSGREWE